MSTLYPGLKNQMAEIDAACSKADEKLERALKEQASKLKGTVKAALALFFERWPEVEWVEWLQWWGTSNFHAPDRYNSDARVGGQIFREWAMSSKFVPGWALDLAAFFDRVDNRGKLFGVAFGYDVRVKFHRDGTYAARSSH